MDFGFEIPAVHLEELLRLQLLRRTNHGFHWGAPEDMARPALTFRQLCEVWDDVKRVGIPRGVTMLAGMISDAFCLCIATERSNARPDHDLNCAKRRSYGELCSHLLKVPGLRTTTSLLRLSQAMAWMDGADRISSKHLLSALPWCLSRRQSFRREELRKRPSPQSWVREVAFAEVLRQKVPFRGPAIRHYVKGETAQLDKMGANDPVARELRLFVPGWLQSQGP